MRSWPSILIFTLMLSPAGSPRLAAQIHGLQGRWTLTNVKDHTGEKKVLKMRRFHDSDKYRGSTLCWNFKKETGYVIEEQFWKVPPPPGQDPKFKTFGYNGKILEWAWESKDKIRVFSGDTFREYKIIWIGYDRLLFREVSSKHPRFNQPFQNLSAK